MEAMTPTTEMFETGIKVVDLLAPTSRAARSGCSAVPAWARP
jgi:F0F1-type ATP synthase beta subunit